MTKEKEELSNNTFIRDVKIEPYFIGKDSHCYTVYETITPDTRYTENNVAGKDYTKALVPKATLQLPVVLVNKAPLPTAVLHTPVVLEDKAILPIATLKEPVVLALNAQKPTAVLLSPVVLDCNDLAPTAVLLDTVLADNE